MKCFIVYDSNYDIMKRQNYGNNIKTSGCWGDEGTW